MRKKNFIAVSLLFISLNSFIPVDANNPSNCVFNKLIYSNNGLHITSKGSIKALAFFIQFLNDSTHPESSDWPINNPPVFLNTYLDSGENQLSAPWSFSDYFRKMSFDSLRITGKSYFYITRHPEKYYRDTLHLGNSEYSEVNREALRNLDSLIDFTLYDNWTFKSNSHIDTSDGKVDLIIFLYRHSIYPPGEAAQGIAVAGYGKDLRLDGKVIKFGFPGSGITNSGGWQGMKGTLRSMKHEFGHLLFGAGHPAYYNAGSKGQILFLGMWGIMPIPGFCANAYEMEKLGWIKLIDVKDNGSFTLPDFASTGTALRIRFGSGKKNEVYILENHHQLSIYDSEIDRDGKGLMIYKVIGSGNHPIYHVQVADGKYDWSNYWVHHPWSADSLDSLPVYTRLNPNKDGFSVRDWIPHNKHGYLNGKFQIFLMDDDGPGGKPHYVFEGWKGNGKTAFNVDGADIFSPWTNPGTEYNSNLSIVLRESHDTSIKIDCFIREIILTEDTVFPLGELQFSHNLIVPEGTTLTINKNTLIKFTNGSSLIVKGILVDNRSE
jgi:M6 family metalloprotease-like protein